jgi:hypothetical protein
MVIVGLIWIVSVLAWIGTTVYALKRKHYEAGTVIMVPVLTVFSPLAVIGVGIYLYRTRNRVEPNWRTWSLYEPGSPEFLAVAQRTQA